MKHGWQWLFVGMLLISGNVWGQGIPKSIERGRDYLLGTMATIGARGERALTVLALSKAGTPADEPRFVDMVSKLAASVGSSEYRPEATPGTDHYEAAVLIMALASVDAVKYRSQIEVITKFLLGRQLENGVWDYSGRTSGDTSQSQYALLGLWEASGAGVPVEPHVWDRALRWHTRHQDVRGGYAYHPQPVTGNARVAQSSVQHSTTAGGLSSLLVCRSRLAFSGRSPTGGKREAEPGEFPLLIPIYEEVEEKEKPRPLQVTKDEVDDAIRLGMNWITTNFTIDHPIGPGFYYLYGVERLGALTNQKTIGSNDWYEQGSAYLMSKQEADGGWSGENYGRQVQTSFAILFLSQSTKKTLQRIEISRLKEATLTGGRGLPTGNELPAELMVRQKARYRAALRSPIDDVLAALASPDESDFDEGAAAAIETAKPEVLIAKLGKSRSGLRKLAEHPNPIVREAGLWAMAKLRDFRFAPILIERLSDSDESVYRAARDGLRYMSRKVEEPVLSDEKPTKDVVDAATQYWRGWYESLNVEVDAEQEFDDGL